MAEIEPSFLSGYARAPDPDFETRADALISVFAKAEKACGLRLDESLSVPQRAEAIVRSAKKANLDPGQYQLFWMIRKWAREASA
jgi:hypothetical protein